MHGCIRSPQQNEAEASCFFAIDRLQMDNHGSARHDPQTFFQLLGDSSPGGCRLVMGWMTDGSRHVEHCIRSPKLVFAGFKPWNDTLKFQTFVRVQIMQKAREGRSVCYFVESVITE